ADAWLPRVGADLERHLTGHLGDRLLVGRVDTGTQHGPSDRPVHRAGVEVRAVERGGEPTRHGRLSRARGAVHGHHPALRHSKPSCADDPNPSNMPGPPALPTLTRGRATRRDPLPTYP